MTAPRLRSATVAVLILASGVRPADAAPPPPVEQVAFAPATGAMMPLDIEWRDEHAARVHIGTYASGRPAIVVPVYYGCSNLCGVVLQGVAAALRDAALEPGRDVEVIAVGIDPLEGPAQALAKKVSVLGEDAAGWHFLTGSASAVERLTSALGYRYAYDAGGRQYAHASGIAFVSPTGRVDRVLYGASFPAGDVREAVASAEAATPVKAGRNVSETATWLLCFHYDPQTGRYTFAAMNAVRVAGALALLGLGIAFVRMRRRESNAAGTPLT